MPTLASDHQPPRCARAVAQSMIGSAYFAIIAGFGLAISLAVRPVVGSYGSVLGLLAAPSDVFFSLFGLAIGGLVFTATTAVAFVVLRNMQNVAALLAANFAVGVLAIAVLEALAWVVGFPPSIVTILLAAALGVSSLLAWLTVRRWSRRDATIEIVDYWESTD